MGKGGGASAPSSQRVEQTSIPSYAQPYVENMLGQTAALTDINQNPYQQFSGQRLAGFTPLQNQAFDRVANQQVASQIGQATTQAQGLAPTALGYGAQGLGIGQMGVGASQQGFGAGEAYRRSATSPSDTQAYMSPYMQNVVDFQKQQAIRDFQKEAPKMQAQAVGQGAFGGNRLALQQAEANRGLQNQLAGIQATGTQDAFKQAQQAQQFGSELGLRGLQAGYQGLGVGLQGVGTGLQGVSGAAQGAGLLGNLGQTQFQQETAITDAQLRAGALQQALQQQGLDVGYQDFLKERNYPYQQLAFQSDMFRGLPLSQSAAQVYTAPPSMGSQLGGLGMTGLGIYGMSGGFKGAKGGLMDAKTYKEGGKIEYAAGGDITMMTIPQLTEALDNPNLSPLEVMAIEKRIMLLSRMASNPQTSQIMSGGLGEGQNVGGGLDTIPSGDTFEAAGGGIVAFSNGGTSKTDDYLAQYTDKKGNVDLNKAALSLLGQARPSSETDSAARQEIQSDIKARQEMRPFELLTRLGVGTLAGTSKDGLTNLGLAGVDTMNAYAKDIGAEQALKRELAKLDAEGATKDDARRLQLAGTLLQIQGQKDSRAAALANAPSGQDRAISRAQVLINNDPLIKKYIKQQSVMAETDPQYQVLEQRIAERQNQIFKTAKVDVPEVTPSKIPDYVEPEKPGMLSRFFGSSKPAASQNKVVPFNQLPN